MTHLKHLVAGFLFSSCFFILPVFSQAFPSIQVNSSPNGNYQLNVQNLANDVSSIFWILGDGHFRTGLTPTHNLVSPSNHIEAHLLKAYKPPQPQKIAYNPNPQLNTSGNQTNSKISMASGQYLKLGTSWNPKGGQMHFTILTFENAGSIQDLSGKIELTFLNNVNHVWVRSEHNNQHGWTSAITTNNSNIISFDFDTLDPGDQRHLLIETDLSQNISGKSIDCIAKMEHTNGDPISTINTSFRIKKSPWDPNIKEVSEEEICALNKPTELVYEIYFQNIGDGYARNVVITDQLPEQLECSSLEVIDSSYPQNLIVNWNSVNEVSFEFRNILLPGLVQSFPRYKPSETIGSVRFSIDTKECLLEEELANKASIVFDTLPPIETPWANTNIILNETECYHDKILCPGDKAKSLVKYSNNAGETNSFDRVYPNPFRDFLTFDFFSDETIDQPTSLAVFNLQGSLILELLDLSKDDGHSQLNIKTEDWPAGIYFIKLNTGKGVQTCKIIKE